MHSGPNVTRLPGSDPARLHDLIRSELPMVWPLKHVGVQLVVGHGPHRNFEG